MDFHGIFSYYLNSFVRTRTRAIKSLFVLILSVITISAHAAASFQVISDFDDTIKITNVRNKPQAIRNTLFSDNIFAGMSTLMESFDDAGGSLNVVSGGIEAIRQYDLEDLAVNSINFEHLFLRKSLFDSTFNFKYAKFLQITSANPAPAILIGDDTQEDPEILVKFKHDHPDRVAALYIHRVTGRKLPAEVNGFFTPFELAVYEYQAGRLSREQVYDIAAAIVSETNIDLIFPEFATCPPSEKHFKRLLGLPATQKELKTITDVMIEHLITICHHSHSYLKN